VPKEVLVREDHFFNSTFQVLEGFLGNKFDGHKQERKLKKRKEQENIEETRKLKN